ncbi:crossover junction endonuclease EME1B-like isoform X2 [Malania oleifera]|uniref:crossover junction endonuclease EME1B-like isoform X2 n=1 Tax=Malania oleifera TaxID=397392 RepID=UPI0025ADBBB9|nr:crossover junction endonuclease EME1B-like isoform X2 [Malania oleifera]
MSRPIPIEVDILSDDEEEEERNDTVSALSTPLAAQFKKPRTDLEPNPTVLVIDDDPTPQKPSLASASSPLFVAETPMSGLRKQEVSIVKCSKSVGDSQTRPSSSPLFVPESPMSGLRKQEVSIVKCSKSVGDSQTRPSSSDQKLSKISGLICLESDSESENASHRETWKENDTMAFGFDGTTNMGNVNPLQMPGDNSSHPSSSKCDLTEECDQPEKDNVGLEQIDSVLGQKRRIKVNAEKKKMMDGATVKKRLTKEERIQLVEEKRLKKEQEKVQKAVLKAEAAEMKKLQREKQKWEKGKLALKSIVAEIDTKVVELGSVGGHLLSRFSEKGLTFRVTSNPIERSIVWTMTVPEEISKLTSEGIVIPYVLLVYEAEEFCNLVTNESLMDHISSTRSRYPTYTICYLINRLMAYINKRDQGQYKNPTNSNGWRRPPVEEVMAKLATHFFRVHSRQCLDEAELAEHVVGLTCSLATCQFRKKLTRLSINANGSLIPKDSVDRNLIKKSTWLKALVAIPKVQPRFAIAIWKKYPTMKSLLSVYMDPSKSVHEKEFLLKDLTTEGLLGGDRRLGEICSKRVYRILMAQSGSIKTDDVEDGADFFTH